MPWLAVGYGCRSVGGGAAVSGPGGGLSLAPFMRKSY